MTGISIRGPKAATQFAVALALLITFSTGLMTGRHIAAEAKDAPGNNGASGLGPHFPYALDKPLRKLALPAVLEEASAVSYMDGKHVGIVQDERGSLFVYSLLEQHITREVPFGHDGDYEGLSIDGNQAWVLKSDGDLFHLTGLFDSSIRAEKIETFLRGGDDTEGLTLDREYGQLLIGLKEPPTFDGIRANDKRAVYAYQLARGTLLERPYLLLDMQEIERVYRTQVGETGKFSADRKRDFQPSDLAVHPVTGHLYHIAARGQLLVVSDRSGLIHYVRKLPKSLFRQPEGISFDPDGNMYIVNEGAGASAILLEFRYQPLAPPQKPVESAMKFGSRF